MLAGELDRKQLPANTAAVPLVEKAKDQNSRQHCAAHDGHVVHCEVNRGGLPVRVVIGDGHEHEGHDEVCTPKSRAVKDLDHPGVPFLAHGPEEQQTKDEVHNKQV